jgi:hypothetical protein
MQAEQFESTGEMPSTDRNVMGRRPHCCAGTVGTAAKHCPCRFPSDTLRSFLAGTCEIGDENPRVACIEDVPAIGTDIDSDFCVEFFLRQALGAGDSPPRQQQRMFKTRIYLNWVSLILFHKFSGERNYGSLP